MNLTTITFRRGARRRCSVVLVGIAPLFATRSAISQLPVREGQATGVIAGTVTDTSLRPIAGADVSILFSRIHVTADSRGRFQFLRMPEGNYLLMARSLGRQPVIAGINVTNGDTARPAFFLDALVASLPTVVVTDRGGSMRFREFEERRRRGNGEFFDQQHIEARNAVSAVDILREAKALRIDIQGPKYYAMSARQWTPCPMQVYVDGVPLAGERPDVPFDLNLLPSPREIMGIEVYGGPESVPLWLPPGPPGGKLACGAILVWTRDGSTK